MESGDLGPVSGPDEIDKTSSIGSIVNLQWDQKVTPVTDGEDTRGKLLMKPGIEGVPDEEGHHRNDSFGNNDNPSFSGAVLDALRANIRQWRSRLRPRTLLHLLL